MPYIRRVDGLDAACAAHAGNALGGLNEIVRDRSIPGDQPTGIVFWTTADDIQPGDEILGSATGTELPDLDTELEANAAAYDALAGPILVLSYERKFIPDKEARVARCEDGMRACDAEVDAAVEALGVTDMESPQAGALRNVIVDRARVQSHQALERRHAETTVALDANRVELAAMKADIAAGRSVRIERLGDGERPGATIELGANLGESVMMERAGRADA